MIRLALFIIVCLCSTISSSASEHPNLVFILADDWGLGDVKAYAGDRCKIDTPVMDQLAREGMMFTDAHSSSAVCTPTRYSVLTGRYNWRTRLKRGVLNGFNNPLILPERETVASFLKKNGYNTAMVGKWHLGMQFPTTDGKPAKSKATELSQLTTHCNIDWDGVIQRGPISVGFDYFWGISASLDMPPYIWIENDRFVGSCTTIKAFHRPGPAHVDFEDYDVLPTLTEKATQFISKQANSEKPFFLYMPLNSPHTPISPSERWKGKSKLGAYGDFVMETDWAVGEVLKAVDQAGLAEKTIFIVTADNGCSPQAQKASTDKMIQFRYGKNDPFEPEKHYPSDIYRGHKADIFEGGHRVPFLVRWSGKVEGGGVCDEPICLVDLYATCADVINQEIPGDEAEDSVSLLPCLLGQNETPIREAVVHHSINGSFSIRKGKWKLVLCPGSGGWSYPRHAKDYSEELPPLQLYDLDVDPAETNNVQAENLEVVNELTALLESYVDRGRSTPGEPQKNDRLVDVYKTY